jgi:NodT family efflux transporter outer membrane factor (OMF) lipoprotein
MTACKLPTLIQKTENTNVPDSFSSNDNSSESELINWKLYFNDPNLTALIDSALANNQELNITLMEIAIAQNEVQARKGEYLPFLNLNAGTGVEKVGRYTSQGANDANTEIAPGKEFPEPLGDFLLGANVSWEVDIWKKLRNAKKSAYMRYLGSVEGKNFMVTNLIAEIANSYYELLALDNQLAILNQNIEIQSNALRIVRQQKESAKVTQLPVTRFEAFVLNTKSQVPLIEQQIIETENKINFLVGRFPQPIVRNAENFVDLNPTNLSIGKPSQLLENRPDIKQSELELEAAKLDVQVAKAQFYPTLGINANLGLQAFNPAYFIKAPESLLFGLAGDLMAPLVNRNAIKATYQNANAKQIQAIYVYEQTILNAFMEVSNQVAKIDNLRESYDLKSQEVDVLNQSVAISNSLFTSARADYMEVLLTQEEVLESRFELIETKREQLNAMVNVYKSLGGGWR